MQLSPPFFGWISCGQVDCEEGSGVIPSVVNNDDTQPFSRACYIQVCSQGGTTGLFFFCFFRIFSRVERGLYPRGSEIHVRFCRSPYFVRSPRRMISIPYGTRSTDFSPVCSPSDARCARLIAGGHATHADSTGDDAHPPAAPPRPSPAAERSRSSEWARSGRVKATAEACGGARLCRWRGWVFCAAWIISRCVGRERRGGRGWWINATFTYSSSTAVGQVEVAQHSMSREMLVALRSSMLCRTRLLDLQMFRKGDISFVFM